MSSGSDAVKRWRDKTKQRIIDAMGGKCCVCGYDKCPASLALHHLDPSKKEFGLGSIRACPENWSKIVSELKKCVLVCSNCHNEIHYNVTQVPKDAVSFNDHYEDYKHNEMIMKMHECEVCGKLTEPWKNSCSPECAAKIRRKVDWDSVDLVKELKEVSILALSKKLGCSDALIHKKLKKLGLK